MAKQSILSRFFGRGVQLEAKGLADPYPTFSALFGLEVTASGAAVSADAALRVPAVGSALRVISEAVACLDRDCSGPAAAVLEKGKAANGWTSSFEMVRDLVIDALTDDNGGLAYITRKPNGEPLELVRYRSGAWLVDYDTFTGEPSYRLGANMRVPARDVVHLRAPFGRAPLSLYREAIGVALMLEQHAARLFQSAARPGGVLMFPKGMGEESVKKARAGWKATHEDAGAGGRTAILYDGAEFKPLSFSSTDAQFLENRKFQIQEVSRAFRVPPSMLFELDRATWGNTEQMGQEFLVYCLEPWLEALEGAFAKCGLMVKFDRDDMTRADLATRATTIASLVAAKVLNRNEGRAWLNMAPVAGGDVFENPNINTDQAPAPAAADDGGEDAA
ncbi:phage portal protein [Gemmobacter aquarius]|uniref:Phage portal protein n=1 Tax=Paragemmobacter aquarius TaxID=2169400 RepID=A0A2S0UM71_9RHOB|nr:phage portal protein [Gemmobacter aquarius]AWB48893.1 phage portal protein [Gemmobacter aquarius]